jgi:DNA-binding MarR family transcriptional regulator
VSPPVRTDLRLQGPLFESPTFVLMQAGRLAMEWAARALEPFELSVAEYAALLLVQRYGGISQGAVGARLGLGKASASGLAVRLERRRFIERRQDVFHPGRRALYITSAGVGALTELAAAVAAVDRRFAKCLGPNGCQALAELPPRRLSPVEVALRAAGAF